MSAGRQEDLGTSNPTTALRSNAFAGYGNGAARHRLLGNAPFFVQLPPEPAADKVCIQQIGRFDASGKQKGLPQLLLTFAPQNVL